jgi:hypothetical protein
MTATVLRCYETWYFKPAQAAQLAAMTAQTRNCNCFKISPEVVIQPDDLKLDLVKNNRIGKHERHRVLGARPNFGCRNCSSGLTGHEFLNFQHFPSPRPFSRLSSFNALLLFALISLAVVSSPSNMNSASSQTCLLAFIFTLCLTSASETCYSYAGVAISSFYKPCNGSAPVSSKWFPRQTFGISSQLLGRNYH